MSELISVCIATCNRPFLLSKTLESLKNQKTNGLFTYEIIVVDNGTIYSDEIVDIFRQSNDISIKYYRQSIKNISLTRNECIEHSSGDYIAFIDDDEIANKSWLIELYATLKLKKCSAVIGPVFPIFPMAKKLPFWYRHLYRYEKQFENLSIIKEGKTGNALIDKRYLNDIRFDSNLGLTGGEDTDLFNKIQNIGGLLYYTTEAIVFETVEEKRLTFKWVFFRNVRCTQGYSINKMKNKNFFIKLFYYSFRLMALMCFCIILIPSFIFGISFGLRMLKSIFCQIGHVSSILPKLRYKEYK